MALVDITVVFPDENTPTIPELSEKIQKLVEEYSGGIMSVVLK